MDFINKNFEEIAQAISKAQLEYAGIEYVPHESSKPEYKQELLKVNIAGFDLLVDGYIRNGISYIKVNSTHMNLRKVMESLGLYVSFDTATDTIYGDLTNDFKPDDESVEAIFMWHRVNLNGYLKDGVNLLKIGDDYIPVRDLMKPFGLDVGWDSEEDLLLINK